MSARRVLFAALEGPSREVSDLLAAHGFDLLLAHDGDTAVRLAMAMQPELLLVRQGLPRKSGCQVCRIVRHLLPALRLRILLFGMGGRGADARWASRHAPDVAAAGECSAELLARALARWDAPPSELRAGESLSGAPLWEDRR